MAPMIIYKTSHNFSDMVAVTMDEQKNHIIAYPAPEDIRGAQKHPDKLNDGYWLDNQGIGKNSVFLDYTFEYYGKLQQPPILDTLRSHIIDNNPVTEMWQCGFHNQYSNPVKAMNAKIKKHLKGCERIK